MHEIFKKSGAFLRGAVALCAAAVVLGVAPQPAAAEVKPAISQARELIPVGHTVGIKLFSRGVLVVRLAEGDTPARACGLETGDLILKCNGTAVTSTEQFQSLVQDPEADELQLQVRRAAKTMTLTAEVAGEAAEERSIGAWIRDSMAGIGTMTFYDPASGVFGALGHGITDVDTAQLMPFASGSILPSTVKAVRRGAVGAAGELRGDFSLNEQLGSLYANTEGGIFGTLDAAKWGACLGQALPIAEKDEVRTGPAVIRSNVAGDEVRDYRVEICKISDQDGTERNLLLSVTDPDLLEKTGGIVQGMSGSPILQNGKIVGAVTHVLLNDPTKGYGIFIRNMLDQAS